jgi:hypothetical protein
MKKTVYVLIFAAVFALVLGSCQDITGTDNASSGALDGGGLQRSVAAVNAIVIRTQQDLEQVNFDPFNDYVLGNDLTLVDWVPIGGPFFVDIPFLGTFDGAGYTITVSSFDSGTLNSYTDLGVFAVIGDGSYLPSPSIRNLTVNIVTAPIVTYTGQNVGGLAGSVNGATLTDITVTGSLTVTYTADSPPLPTKVLKDGDTFRVVGLGDPGTDGLAAGGVAGSIVSSTVLNAHTAVSINAITTSVWRPVYVGGVTGYTNGTMISGSWSRGNIIGNGSGNNTSAGGIAGYIIASTVTGSFASGTVDVTALTSAYTMRESWWAYAGGLVGYAGGIVDTASQIRLSHADSSVTAYSPFPYAGGLVGYACGIDNFTYPPSNGTIIRQSYATGDVFSIAQQDPNGVYGGVPFAGGLVGYSMLAGSLIEDSYARGFVLAETTGTFACAGGLVGSNANDSVVNRTYATGDVLVTTGGLPPVPMSPQYVPWPYAPYYVNPGPAVGGIAGYNYFTVGTVISNSVALNRSVHGNQTTQNVAHRVAGDLSNVPYTGRLVDNLANEDMKVGDNWQRDIGLDRRDGGDTAAQPDTTIYAGLGWDFKFVWLIGADGYPALW